MLRIIFYVVLLVLLARAVGRFWQGLSEGINGGTARGGRVPEAAVHMVRDPVCGIYVVPDRALALTHGSGQVYFCSAGCRDKYRARPSGRTA